MADEAQVAGETAGSVGETAPATVAPKRVRNDVEAFMDAWETSETKQAAADKLGIGLMSLETRAAGLRKAGVPLKVFPRKVTAKTPANLLAILAKVRNVTVEQLQAEIDAKNAEKAPAQEGEQATA